MMTVTREQRRADPVSIKIAHNFPFVRMSFASTATMQKVMIRIAEKERERGAIQSFFKSPQIPSVFPKTHSEGGSVSVAINYHKRRITDITVQKQDRCLSLPALASTTLDKKPCNINKEDPKHLTGKGRLLPMRLVEMFTISPENLEGSIFLGESMVFKENRSASGKKPVWESLVLTNSFWST